MKNAYITVVLSFIFTIASGQKIKDENFIGRYSNSILNEKKEGDYLLVRIVSANEEKKKQLAQKAIRQLTHTLYILEKADLKNVQISSKEVLIYSISNNDWKLSSICETLMNEKQLRQQNFLFTLETRGPSSLEIFKKNKELKLLDIKYLNDQNVLSLFTTSDVIKKYFLNNPEVIAIDVNKQAPHEELAIKGFDLSANKVNKVHNDYPDINGAGQHVSVKENYYDTADIDLKGRLDPSPLASKTITNHANFMATIIAGAGNSVYYAKGAAWGANISSSSFDLILPDSSNYYRANQITVQNHSYGTEIENAYGVNAMAFDKSANDNQDLLHVFSSGNSGTSASASGNYSGIAGFANVTGNFKMAKNNIVIGAADSFGNVVPLSSRGPAYDGRIKPELVAFQMNGTSEAAALVSGSVLLLQQFYKKKNNKNLPSALAKALLINNADDVNINGPDYATGFGNMNAGRAMDAIKNNLIWIDSVNLHSTKHFSVVVPPNITKMKVTLTWNDTVAKTFVPKALVNDLDLVVSNQSNSWQPWVLSSYPHIDSLMKPAVRGRDSLNNVEQVIIENPPTGAYDLSVNGFDMSTKNQIFYVSYSFDTLSTFKWDRPGTYDFLQGGKTDILRWETTFSTTGTLEYTYPGTSNWIPIISNIDLSKNSLFLKVPDTVAQILFKMRIGNRSFYSDTFQIAKLLSPKIGYLCKDSLLMYWERLAGIGSYQVYQLGSLYMEPFGIASDTAIIINKQSLINHFLAVSPILKNGKAGIKSYSFDYTTQGAGCYINSFIAVAVDKTAQLSLSLGTGFQVQKITFETLTATGFKPIYNQDFNGGTDITYTYLPLIKGINSFRAKVTLSTGIIIYSDIVPVAYVDESEYKLIPVPVKKYQPLQFISASPAREVFQIINATGKLVYEKLILFKVESIPTMKLSKGNYYYRVIKEGKEVGRGRFIVI